MTPHEDARAALEAWLGDPAAIIVELVDPVPGEIVRRLIPPRPDWHRDALCREYPAAWWFPTLGQTAQRAIEICRQCPVRIECLDEALADPDLDSGVRGGMAERARAAHRRADGARRRRKRTSASVPRRSDEARSEVGDPPASRFLGPADPGEDPARQRLSDSETSRTPRSEP